MSGEEAQGGLEGDRLKEMESRMMDRITSLLESAQKKKEKFEEEKAPKVTGKGIQKSLDFNTNLKNLLRKAVHDGEFMEPLAQQVTCFALYTTPTPHPDKAQYVGLDEQVFTVFAKTIAAGFDLGPDVKQTTMHISLIKSTIEKKRAEFNKKHGKASSAASVKDFKNEIKKNPYFRRNEHSL
uniref:Uncharacterized protein n=1 Tax=Caenorhabditis japonica TaxID=281687 RepID=A0A8R1EF89_CAEJA